MDPKTSNSAAIASPSFAAERQSLLSPPPLMFSPISARYRGPCGEGLTTAFAASEISASTIASTVVSSLALASPLCSALPTSLMTPSFDFDIGIDPAWTRRDGHHLHDRLQMLDQCSNHHLRLATESPAVAALTAASTPVPLTAGISRSPEMVSVPVSRRLGKSSNQDARCRKRFLIFTKLLLKCLSRVRAMTPDDERVYQHAKAVLRRECNIVVRRRRGHHHHSSNGMSRLLLVSTLERELRPVVGETQWRRATACLDLFLEKKSRQQR